MDILKGKPTNIIAVKSDATYDQIKHAIRFNQIPNKTLRAVVNSCKTNPSKVLFVIYKAYSDSVLMVFGEKPVVLEMEGSKLQNIMMHHCTDGSIYVFSYVK